MTSRLGAGILAAALIASPSAFAADTSAPDASAPTAGVQPLAPGQAAGIHAAQTTKQLNGIAIGAGLLLGAAAIYLIAGTHYHVPPQSASGTH